MFEGLRSVFGAYGPVVDTVLSTPVACVGGPVNGWVQVHGGADEFVFTRLVVGLVAEGEFDDRHSRRTPWFAELDRRVVGRDVRVPANQTLNIPFSLTLPWEAPISAVGAAVLPVHVGVRTELVVHNARDASDLDHVLVQPLPSQNRVLDAMGELGATFTEVDIWHDPIPGAPQVLSFCLKLRFFPPLWAVGELDEVELGFVATATDLWVVLGAAKRGRLFRFGFDLANTFHTTHHAAELTDWTSLIGNWLAQACRA